MNEKIREIAKDADLDWHKFWDGEENRLEKFTERIVRECLKFECDAGVYTKHDLADAIKRHFGVEP